MLQGFRKYLENNLELTLLFKFSDIRQLNLRKIHVKLNKSIDLLAAPLNGYSKKINLTATQFVSRMINLYFSNFNKLFSMKAICLACMIVCQCSSLFAQQTALDNFNVERQRIAKNGVYVIGSYAAANVIYGAIAAQNATGSTKYFHEMNAIFNGVTLGISALGIITAKKEGRLNYVSSLKKQHGLEKLFLFNAGLDLAYIAGGAYMQERAKTTINNSLKQKGYGQSIMIQGGVLFLFDGIMYYLNKKHGEELYKLGESIQLAATRNGIGVIVKL